MIEAGFATPRAHFLCVVGFCFGGVARGQAPPRTNFAITHTTVIDVATGAQHGDHTVPVAGSAQPVRYACPPGIWKFQRAGRFSFVAVGHARAGYPIR